jgi:hypothetical protein
MTSVGPPTENRSPYLARSGRAQAARGLTHTVRVVDAFGADTFDLTPHGRPRHAEPAGDRRDCPLGVTPAGWSA